MGMNMRFLIIVFVLFVIGGLVGYYFGYDLGWENAMKHLNLTANTSVME
jgi:hypothetical protein